MAERNWMPSCDREEFENGGRELLEVTSAGAQEGEGVLLPMVHSCVQFALQSLVCV